MSENIKLQTALQLIGSMIEHSTLGLAEITKRAIDSVHTLDKAFPIEDYPCHLNHPDSCKYEHCYACKHRANQFRDDVMPCMNCAIRTTDSTLPCYYYSEYYKPYVPGGYVEPVEEPTPDPDWEKETDVSISTDEVAK